MSVQGDGVIALLPLPSCACLAGCSRVICLRHFSAPSQPYRAPCPVLPAPSATPPAVHDALDPEMSILKQRIARRLRHEGHDDNSVKDLDLGEWGVGRERSALRQHLCHHCLGCCAGCLKSCQCQA